MSLKRTIFVSVVVFSTFSLLLLIRHEYFMITQNSGIHVTDNYKLRERFRSAYEASVQIVEKIQNISAGDFVFPQPLEKFFFSFDAADDDETDPAGEEGKPAASNSNNGEVEIRDGYETPNESVNSQDIIPENNNNQKIELIESKSISTDTTNNVGEPKVVLDDLVKEVLEFSRSLRPPSKTLFPSMSLLSSSSSSFEEKLDMINSIQLEDPHPLISTRESISETELLPIKSSTSTTSSNLRTQKSVDQEITAQLESGYSDDDDDDDGTDDDTITLLTSTELSSSIKKDSSVSDTSSSRKSSLASNKIENIGDDDDNDDDDDTEDDIILFPVSNTKTSVNKGEAKETARIGAIVDDDDLSLDNDDFDDDDDDVFDNSSTGTGAAGSKSKSIVAKNDEINTSTSTSNDGYTPHNVAPDVAAELSKSGVRKPRHKKGTLTCKGKNIDSGVIYWRDVEGDKSYISPIIPPTDPSAHGADATRYLSFEYDAGGWNNMRMSMECLIVLAHAFNRTLVLPPPQHIYLLSQKFVAKVDGKKKVFSDEMGFEDFFHVDAMRSQEGMNIMSMKEFLTKEGITGGLNGIYPPGNNTDIWGRQVLWPYLDKVADILPVWGNSYFALPLPGHDYTFSDIADYPPSVQARFKRWKVDREPINYYNQSFQRARHLHVPGEGHHRILMHHYSYIFAADLGMQQFYKRFVRDYIRYKDEIFCVAHDVVEAIRKDALEFDPASGGQFYSLHIRRGDFQFKDVKISAQKIWENLHLPDGSLVIPNNSFVYIATDDPDGLCKDCLYNKKPCESYSSPKPVGCPEDTSWDAFRRAGWKLKFLRDYSTLPSLVEFNPNYFGMVEVIIGTQAKAFAGTVHSTFTGLTLRIRGFQGRTSSSYYHSNGALLHLQKSKEKGGVGWWREWSYGWHDDLGTLV